MADDLHRKQEIQLLSNFFGAPMEPASRAGGADKGGGGDEEDDFDNEEGGGLQMRLPMGMMGHNKNHGSKKDGVPGTPVNKPTVGGKLELDRRSRDMMRQVSGLGMEDPVFGLSSRYLNKEGKTVPTKKPWAFFDDMSIGDIAPDMRDLVSVCSDPTASVVPTALDAIEEDGFDNFEISANNKKTANDDFFLHSSFTIQKSITLGDIVDREDQLFEQQQKHKQSNKPTNNNNNNEKGSSESLSKEIMHSSRISDSTWGGMELDRFLDGKNKNNNNQDDADDGPPMLVPVRKPRSSSRPATSLLGEPTEADEHLKQKYANDVEIDLEDLFNGSEQEEEEDEQEVSMSEEEEEEDMMAAAAKSLQQMHNSSPKDLALALEMVEHQTTSHSNHHHHPPPQPTNESAAAVNAAKKKKRSHSNNARRRAARNNSNASKRKPGGFLQTRMNKSYESIGIVLDGAAPHHSAHAPTTAAAAERSMSPKPRGRRTSRRTKTDENDGDGDDNNSSSRRSKSRRGQRNTTTGSRSKSAARRSKSSSRRQKRTNSQTPRKTTSKEGGGGSDSPAPKNTSRKSSNTAASTLLQEAAQAMHNSGTFVYDEGLVQEALSQSRSNLLESGKPDFQLELEDDAKASFKHQPNQSFMNFHKNNNKTSKAANESQGAFWYRKSNRDKSFRHDVGTGSGAAAAAIAQNNSSIRNVPARRKNRGNDLIKKRLSQVLDADQIHDVNKAQQKREATASTEGGGASTGGGGGGGGGAAARRRASSMAALPIVSDHATSSVDMNFFPPPAAATPPAAGYYHGLGSKLQTLPASENGISSFHHSIRSSRTTPPIDTNKNDIINHSERIPSSSSSSSRRRISEQEVAAPRKTSVPGRIRRSKSTVEESVRSEGSVDTNRSRRGARSFPAEEEGGRGSNDGNDSGNNRAPRRASAHHRTTRASSRSRRGNRRSIPVSNSNDN